MKRKPLDARTLREVKKRFGAGCYKAERLIKSAVLRGDFTDALRYQTKEWVFGLVTEMLDAMIKEAAPSKSARRKGR